MREGVEHGDLKLIVTVEIHYSAAQFIKGETVCTFLYDRGVKDFLIHSTNNYMT